MRFFAELQLFTVKMTLKKMSFERKHYVLS
jgi:hypothetical protein